jgi:hypothetical protein
LDTGVGPLVLGGSREPTPAVIYTSRETPPLELFAETSGDDLASPVQQVGRRLNLLSQVTQVQVSQLLGQRRPPLGVSRVAERLGRRIYGGKGLDMLTNHLQLSCHLTRRDLLEDGPAGLPEPSEVMTPSHRLIHPQQPAATADESLELEL